MRERERVAHVLIKNEFEYTNTHWVKKKKKTKTKWNQMRLADFVVDLLSSNGATAVQEISETKTQQNKPVLRSQTKRTHTDNDG
jgi:serine kinase of HPr protein (carbohydrate metabolism regulator)